jgi:hypothetical protein
MSLGKNIPNLAQNYAQRKQSGHPEAVAVLPMHQRPVFNNISLPPGVKFPPTG